MENNDNDNLPSTTLCKAGCGFFGASQFDGMCSMCYGDAVKRKQAAPNVPMSMAPAASSHSSSSSGAHCSSSSLTHVASSSSFTTASSEPTIAEQSAAAAATMDLSAAAAAGGSACESPESEGSPAKKKRTKCLTCKKKVGLTGFECRCGGLFCSLHRYSDKHQCTFDYREHGAAMIRKNNPVIVGEKITKI